MTDVTGICCFLPPSPPAATNTRKHNVFNLMDVTEGKESDTHDQKFVILTPLHVHMLAFNNGKEWACASESQQGLSLLASLSAFYPTVEVLHCGFMSKKRERTGHTPAKPSMISIWKRHYFVFLSSGDLLYFRDETMGELQGRVDVKHAPTVRVTGERIIDEKKKDLGAMLMKFAKLPGAGDRENCLVWIATPPSKMFVLKVQDEQESASSDRRRQQLTAAAKKWLSLLLQGHAETKYCQLEQCISTGKFEATPEMISAIRAGIPDELRGAMWKGLSEADELQRRVESKTTIKRVTKTTSIRTLTAKDTSQESSSNTTPFFDQLCEALDSRQLNTIENRMIYSRLAAVALYEASSPAGSSELIVPNDADESMGKIATWKGASATSEEADESVSDSEHVSPMQSKLKQVARGALGHYVYPSDSFAPEWELLARRRLLIASSRFNPYSHPCAWKVPCLLLAYLDEESSFWVINSVHDVYLAGYFHGHRPALQIDASAFVSLLQERAPSLASYLRALSFPIERTMERWFLSMFTSTQIPLPTVLRIWDAFFAQGLRVFFGVGLAYFLRAEASLFRAQSAAEATEILKVAERSSIDTDSLFSHVFSADLEISWLSAERLERVRTRHRKRLAASVHQRLEVFKHAVSTLNSIHDQVSRLLSSVRVTNVCKSNAASSVLSAAAKRFASLQHDVEPDHEQEGDPLAATLHNLQACFGNTLNAITRLDKDIKSRQVQWLALSSQLSGCPLSSSDRLTPDLLSWLSQVKEGKVSGAGLDQVSSGNNTLAASEMFIGPADPGTCSFLVANRPAFGAMDRFAAENVLYAVGSTIQSMCAARLECIASIQRTQLLNGFWLQTPLEKRPVRSGSGSASGSDRSSARNLRRAASTASTPSAPMSPASSSRPDDGRDAYQLRSSLDDSVLRPRIVGGHSPRLTKSIARLGPHEDPQPATFKSGISSIHMQYESSFYQPVMVTSRRASPSHRDNGMPSLKHLEQSIHTAVGVIVRDLGHFVGCIKVLSDSDDKADLHTRASALEAELIHDVASLDDIVRQTSELI